MDASLSRSSIPRRADPHDWNTFDHYRTIHEQRLAEHPFVLHADPSILDFVETGNDGVLLLEGDVHCSRGVTLRVEKRFESRYSGGLRRIRCYSYRYAAWVTGGNPVLRYHNVHQNDDDYHHRVFDPLTGEEVFYERLERYQFPLFNEVLDEIELVTRPLAPDFPS